MSDSFCSNPVGLVIRPIRNADELKAVIECGRADDRAVIGATHMVMKHNQIMGALSFIPTVMTWTDTQRFKARDSLALQTFIEGLVASQGGNMVMQPAKDDCPYYPYLKKLNHTNIGKFDLFVKGLYI